MAYTLIEAAKLSRNPLARGVMTALATSDELISQVPMVPTPGASITYNREKALPTVEFVSPTHTSLAESSATFDEVTVPLRLIVSDVDVYDFVDAQQGDENAQKPMQIEKKVKALGRTIGQKLVTGTYASGATISPAMAGVALASVGPNQDSDRMGPGTIVTDGAADNLRYRAPGDKTFGAVVTPGADGTFTLFSDNPNKWIRLTITKASLPASATESNVYVTTSSNEWDGLNALIPTSHSQVISSSGANGDELSFGALDRAIDEYVKVRENLYFVGNSKLKTKFLGLLRGLGGTTPDQVQLPGLNRPVPAYRGIPFLQNDWITSAESKGGSSTLSSLFLVSLSEEGLTMRVGQGAGAQMATLDPRAARLLGVRVRDVGVLEDKEATRTRVSFYGAPRLGSELAMCRIRELVTA